MSEERQRNLKDSVKGHKDAKAALKEFLESRPLYSKLRVRLPDHLSQALPDALFLHCPACNTTTPFRDDRPSGGGAGLPPPPKRDSGVYSLYFRCTGCRKSEYLFWVEVNYKEEWVRKVGQLPMWLPSVPKDIADELGEDTELYQKALRNMAEGYGIGACAYLRRLIEKHINPLLRLLYEVKKDQGVGEDELAKIDEAIASKNFTAKTEFAAEIAPASIIVEGHNPLKEIHDGLSVGLHSLDEGAANDYATKIRSALEFVVRRLRREVEERRAYAASLKKARKRPAE
jgi:hypothetical protein